MADLREFADTHIPPRHGPDFATLGGGRYHRGVLTAGQPEDGVATVLAVVLWQILVETDEFKTVRDHLALRPDGAGPRDRAGAGSWPVPPGAREVCSPPNLPLPAPSGTGFQGSSPAGPARGGPCDVDHPG